MERRAIVTFSSVPVRQPEPDVAESDFSRTSNALQANKAGTNSIAYLRLLWLNRDFMMRAGFYALLASVLVALLIPSRYKSVARLMPPDNQSASGLASAVAAFSGGGASMSGGGGAGLLGGIAGELLGLKSTSEIFVGILSSRTVQDKLIRQFDLQRLYWDRRMEDTRKDLANHTDITVDRKSQIIAITVTDRDPRRAAAMNQAYVQELNRLVAELSTSSARRERIFLEERLQSVSKDLESAEKDFSQFSSKNTAIDMKEQAKAMVEAAAILQGQLIAAESELEGLRQIYTDSNVRVRAVRARIEELKRQLDKIGGKDEGSTTPSAQSADSLYPSIRKLPLLGVTYADLYRRTRVQEAVFETLTKEYELAKVQEVKELPVVKVLDAPHIPDKKSFPPRLLMAVLGTLVGLGLASTWLFGKTSWEQTDSADPRKALALDVFATMKASLPKFAGNGLGSQHAEGESSSSVRLREDGDEVPK
jgi:capsule polysaccharide export protein KpsE/RkpR